MDDAIDPRIAAALALQQQNAGPPPAAYVSPDLQPPTPMAARLADALQQNVASVAPQVNATPAPTPDNPRPLPPNVQQQIPLQQPSLTAMVPQVDQSTAPVPATPPTKPGPLKSLLQNFLAGAGGAMQHSVGLPTAYDKQQNAAQLALSQQAASDTSAYRQAQTGKLQANSDQLEAQNAPYTFGKDDSIPVSLQGQTFPTVVAQGLLKVLTQNKGKLDNTTQQGENRQDALDTQGQNALQLEGLRQNGGNPKDHAIRSVNGQIVMVSKRDGSVIKTLGTDTALLTPQVRARANAQYAAAQVMDASGNPTTVSRLDQLQSGAPTMTEKTTQALAGDKVGTDTYLNANHTVRNNLYVLQDPTQRAIIARATEDVEKNPGAIDSTINSYLQQGLSPQGAQLIAAMKQMNEFGATFKKYTGNGGAATDSLRNTIHSNQPSTANSMAVNLNLLSQDEKLAEGVTQILNRPGSYTVPSKSKPSNAPASTPAPAAANFFQKFGGVPIK